ncbi:MAG TPA: sulfatase [Solirubrobacteraceae bacterium]|jgi:arylsulfatase A-like enzyme
MTRRLLILSAVATLALSAVAGPAAARTRQLPKRPNIVFVLTDDLASNLVRYMPHVKAMERQGATFSNYFVANSLCCPSRAAILTGEYPHNTGVLSNDPPSGGFDAFRSHGDESHTFATAMQSTGYATALMGKYLNKYQPRFSGSGKGYVPPGWTEWDAGGFAYAEYNYYLNENGTAVHYGSRPENYLTDVIGNRGEAFIDRSVTAEQPFVLELATFAPPSPYTPAARDVHTFNTVDAPRTKAYDTPMANAPAWLGGRGPLTDKQNASIDTDFRNRVRSVQAVDRTIGNLEQTLKAHGVAKNTYIVFTSDNGYHMGEHRLLPGKQTPYDTDVRVPLVVTGPGVKAKHTVTKLTSEIDLAPTFDALAGAKVKKSAMDGQSLVPFLRAKGPKQWRLGTLIEHFGAAEDPSDPDFQTAPSGTPPSYSAVRTANALYVEYANGGREYHDLKQDPEDNDNTFGSLSTTRKDALRRLLIALERCKGQDSCLRASKTR